MVRATEARPAPDAQAGSDIATGGGMSEQGWRRFLAAEGVADWVVLHGGATAVSGVVTGRGRPAG
jgi:hypothetical protein